MPRALTTSNRRSLDGALGGVGGVIGDRPNLWPIVGNTRGWDSAGPPASGGVRFDRTRGLFVAVIAVLSFVLVGSMLGRFVWQLVEHPRTLTVSIDARGCPDTAWAKPSDVFQLWAYPIGAGNVLSSVPTVRLDSRDASLGSVSFEVTRDMPPFQVVDRTTGWDSEFFTYADLAAKSGPDAMTGCGGFFARG